MVGVLTIPAVVVMVAVAIAVEEEEVAVVEVVDDSSR